MAAYETVSVGEASGFACRFAADYLSWDEDVPAHRAAALCQYLPDSAAAVLGWSGTGLQRADQVVAGRTAAFRGAMIVEVTARVTVYHRGGDEHHIRPRMAEQPPPLAFAPASAPPPSAPGWQPGTAWWVRIAPPVRRGDDGRLVIDLTCDPATPPT